MLLESTFVVFGLSDHWDTVQKNFFFFLVIWFSCCLVILEKVESLRPNCWVAWFFVTTGVLGNDWHLFMRGKGGRRGRPRNSRKASIPRSQIKCSEALIRKLPPVVSHARRQETHIVGAVKSFTASLSSKLLPLNGLTNVLNSLCAAYPHLRDNRPSGEHNCQLQITDTFYFYFLSTKTAYDDFQECGFNDILNRPIYVLQILTAAAISTTASRPPKYSDSG